MSIVYKGDYAMMDHACRICESIYRCPSERLSVAPCTVSAATVVHWMAEQGCVLEARE